MAHSHDKIAKGVVGYTQRITTQAPISTGLTTLLSLPITTEAGRTYKITAACNLFKEGSTGLVNAYIYQDGVQLQRFGRDNTGAGNDRTYHGTTVVRPSAGSHTYELRVQFGANTLNQALAEVTNPTFLLIEDIGATLAVPQVVTINAFSDVVTTISGTDYRVITWHSSGELFVNGAPLTGVEYLVIGGGGGGGGIGAPGRGGGGGAGGFVTNLSVLPLVLVGGSYLTVIGAGGATSTTLAVPGSNGQNSSFHTITANGGGGGGSRGTSATPAEHNGANGASGGGASNGVAGITGVGGTGIAGQGFAGGAGAPLGISGGEPYPSGGGGGASQVGVTPVAGGRAGNGGNGLTTTIRGTTETFAGGGGAGDRGLSAGRSGFGGAGGGGNGAVSDVASTAGTANTGGGGGGASDTQIGASGGSGIIVVRFPLANQA